MENKRFQKRGLSGKKGKKSRLFLDILPLTPYNDIKLSGGVKRLFRQSKFMYLEVVAVFIQAYKRAISVLAKKPFRLWGLSLLAGVIGVFASVLTFPALSLVGTCFTMVVGVGMAKVYLDGLDGKQVNSDQLFAGFKRFWSVLGGVAWKMLWSFIWVIIACVGALAVFLIFALPSFFSLMSRSGDGVGFGIGSALAILTFIGLMVFAYIKTLSYSFVEYLLITDEKISATEALRKSVRLTRGKKGQIFLADFVFGVAVGLVTGILTALTAIPYLGFLFGIVLVAFLLVVLLFKNVFMGLTYAALFKMATEPQPQQPYGQQPYGGQPYGGQPYAQQPYQAPQQPYQAPQQPYQAPQQPYQQAPQQPYQAPQNPANPQQ